MRLFGYLCCARSKFNYVLIRKMHLTASSMHLLANVLISDMHLTMQRYSMYKFCWVLENFHRRNFHQFCHLLLVVKILLVIFLFCLGLITTPHLVSWYYTQMFDTSINELTGIMSHELVMIDSSDKFKRRHSIMMQSEVTTRKYFWIPAANLEYSVLKKGILYPSVH